MGNKSEMDGLRSGWWVNTAIVAEECDEKENRRLLRCVPAQRRHVSVKSYGPPVVRLIALWTICPTRGSNES